MFISLRCRKKILTCIKQDLVEINDDVSFILNIISNKIVIPRRFLHCESVPPNQSPLLNEVALRVHQGRISNEIPSKNYVFLTAHRVRLWSHYITTNDN